MCFSGSRPPHFFRSLVRIGIGPTHFLRWIFYYCVCIQHDIDKACFSKHCFVTAEFNIFISPADYGVWTDPHFYTDLRPWQQENSERSRSHLHLSPTDCTTTRTDVNSYLKTVLSLLCYQCIVHLI